MDEALAPYRRLPRHGSPRHGVLDCDARALFVVPYKCGISSFHEYAASTSNAFAVNPLDARLVRSAVVDNNYRLVFVWRDPMRRFASWYFNWLRRSFVDNENNEEAYAAHGFRLLRRYPPILNAVQSALCERDDDSAALDALLPILPRLALRESHLRVQRALFGRVLALVERTGPDVVLETDSTLADKFSQLTGGRSLPRANNQTPPGGFERLFGAPGDHNGGRYDNVRSALRRVYAVDYACVERNEWSSIGATDRSSRTVKRREDRLRRFMEMRNRRTTSHLRTSERVQRMRDATHRWRAQGTRVNRDPKRVVDSTHPREPDSLSEGATPTETFLSTIQLT